MSTSTRPADWVSAQGNYAGSVSRLSAYVIDLAVSTALYWLVLTFISFVVQIITGHPVAWHRQDIVVIITYVAWQFFYFGASWAAPSGRTLGMAMLGIHVVRADGARLEPKRGWLRSLTFPLGFLTLGIGFLSILVQREHRAVYDLIAGTAVVYEWDARAARLRFLAREGEATAVPARAAVTGPDRTGSPAGPSPAVSPAPDGQQPADDEDHPPRVTPSQPHSGNR
jgi:uncharacterized RDD family membrane protein YckC